MKLEIEKDKKFWRNYLISIAVISVVSILCLSVNSALTFENWLFSSLFGAGGTLFLAVGIGFMQGGIEKK